MNTNAIGLAAVSILAASSLALTNATASTSSTKSVGTTVPSAAPLEKAGPEATPRAAATPDVGHRPTEESASRSASALSAPTGPAGLAALYEQLGLDVPREAIARSARPGCKPRSSGGSGTEAVEGGGSPPPPVELVPEGELPEPVPATPFEADHSVIAGHGMWLWQYTKTEGGNYRRMVQRAVDAGFDHVWVRVGDSRDGFYAQEYLDAFVPLAHEAGLRVIGWGFPFLLDPEQDTAWTNEALAWVGPHGRGLDAYSPDIERESEGVVLTERRVRVHLAGLRAAHPELPIIATVYPATDWIMESGYPYEAMAPYVDAFATMDYWACGDAGLRAAHSIRRLSDLRPVHVIGQAFSGGRTAPPSSAETLRFLDTAVREGAVGASWWVWQLIGDEQWNTIADYPWHDAVASHARAPEPAVLPQG